MLIRLWVASGMSSHVTQFQNPEFVKWNIDISDTCSNIITNFKPDFFQKRVLTN